VHACARGQGGKTVSAACCVPLSLGRIRTLTVTESGSVGVAAVLPLRSLAWPSLSI
jgi:hypothetical protein